MALFTAEQITNVAMLRESPDSNDWDQDEILATGLAYLSVELSWVLGHMALRVAKLERAMYLIHMLKQSEFEALTDPTSWAARSGRFRSL